MIPILDLTQQYRAIKAEVDAAMAHVLENGVFVMGPNVKAFENEMAAYLSAGHAISMNSGTDALHLALRALNIGAGDEVITSPFTFVATTEAIGIVGATPVFADIDPETFNIDPKAVEKAITSRTKAIMPVHLYGLPAAMAEIVPLAKSYSLAVVEDCAQAIGATIDGRMVGTFGDIGCFSFFPTKNLGAYGDGGMACTNDPAIAERLRALRVHGGAIKYHHSELGVNTRLDEIQAAILRVKLRHLDRWTQERRTVARRYDDGLGSVPGLQTPFSRTGDHVYHQYTVRVQNRDRVKESLETAGVQTMVYYPVPLHLQKVHEALRLTAGSFAHSERAANEVLSLPMFPELSVEQQAVVIERATACCRSLSVYA